MMDILYVVAIPFLDQSSAERFLHADGCAGKVIKMTEELYDNFDTTTFLKKANTNIDDEISEILNTWSDKEKKHLYQLLYNSGIRIN